MRFASPQTKKLAPFSSHLQSSAPAEPDRVWFRFMRLHQRMLGQMSARIRELGLSIPQILLATAVLNALVAIYIYTLVPEYIEIVQPTVRVA